jgi:HEAT repeat protein
VFAEALRSEHADARANAAWALGVLGAPANTLLPLLNDKDPRVLQATLLALGRAPGDVSAEVFLPFLAHEVPAVRGAAALALARHQPDVALKAIPVQLRLEIAVAQRLGDGYLRSGKGPQTQAEIDEIMGYFRCQMKMVQAISMLKGAGAMRVLEEQAFRPDEDSATFDGIVAAFQLWDKIGADARLAVQALGSADTQMADRTEWMLVQGGQAVLPEVRKALDSQNAAVRQRAIRIVAWQGDTESLETLRATQKTDPADAALTAWAIEEIESLHPKL